MVPILGHLFARRKKEDTNLINFLRDEEIIGTFDKKAHELHFASEAVEGDASIWVIAAERECAIDDENFLCRIIKDVLVRVGHISTSGDIISLATNKKIGSIVPYYFSEKEDFLKDTIIRSALLVYKDALPIPDENEYTRRIKAINKNGAFFQANLDKIHSWISKNVGNEVIFKTTMVGHETLLSRMIVVIDGDKIILKPDKQYKGLGRLSVPFRDFYDLKMIELDEHTEFVEVDGIGGISLVRKGQFFSFLPLKELKYYLYDIQNSSAVGHIDIEDKHMPYYPVKWTLIKENTGNKEVLYSNKDSSIKDRYFDGMPITDSAIYAKRIPDGKSVQVGMIDKNGFILQQYDQLRDQVIGKVEPLPKEDHLAILAKAARKMLFTGQSVYGLDFL